MSRAQQDDLYAVLEVPRTASQDEIKRAYKKLALKWHPDKNTDNRVAAEQQFKKISEAYEVLSNEEARGKYDRYGMAGVRGEAPSSPSFSAGSPHFSTSGSFGGRPRGFAFHDPFEVFRNFFGDHDAMFGDMGMGMGGFGGANPRDGRRQQQRDPFGHGSPFSMMMGGSMFNDDFMMGGGGQGFTTMSMSSSSFGGGPGSKSISSTTEIRNGRKVTRTVTRTTDANGTVHEDVDERVEDVPMGRGHSGYQSIGTGSPAGRRNGSYTQVGYY